MSSALNLEGAARALGLNVYTACAVCSVRLFNPTSEEHGVCKRCAPYTILATRHHLPAIVETARRLQAEAAGVPTIDDAPREAAALADAIGDELADELAEEVALIVLRFSPARLREFALGLKHDPDAYARQHVEEFADAIERVRSRMDVSAFAHVRYPLNGSDANGETWWIESCHQPSHPNLVRDRELARVYTLAAARELAASFKDCKRAEAIPLDTIEVRP